MTRERVKRKQRKSFFFFLLCHGSYSSLFLLHSNSYKWVIKADSNSRGGDIDISVGRVSTDVQKCLEHPHSQLRGLLSVEEFDKCYFLTCSERGRLNRI